MGKQNKYVQGCVKGLEYENVKWYQMYRGDLYSSIFVVIACIALMPLTLLSIFSWNIKILLPTLILWILPIIVFVRSHRRAEQYAIKRNKQISNAYLLALRNEKRENEKMELLRKMANQEKE